MSTVQINVDLVTGVRKEWKVTSQILTQILVRPTVIQTQECEAVGVETRNYSSSTEQTTLSRCKNGTGVQTTIIIDKQSGVSTILDEHLIDIGLVGVAPVIPEVIIAKHNFEITVTRDVTLQTVVDFVKVQNPVLIDETPISTVVETHGQIRKVTMVFEVRKQKERVVTIYNPNLENPTTIIEDIKIEDISPVSVTTSTNSAGQTVVISNSVQEIRKVTAQVDTAITTISQTYGEVNIGDIESVETSQLTGSTDFTFVIRTQSGMTQQISASVISSTGTVVITDSQVLPVNNTVIKPVPLPIVTIGPETPIATEIVEVIGGNEEFSNQIGQNIQVVSITSQTSSIGNAYQVVVTSESSNEFTVIIEQDALTQEFIIVDSRPATQVEIVEMQITEETVEIETEPITGVTFNWTVSANVTTDDLVYVPELPAGATIGGVLTIEYTHSIEQTTVYRFTNGSGVQVTAIVNNQTGTVQGVYVLPIVLVPEVIPVPVLPEVVITREDFEETVRVDTTLSTVVKYIRETKPVLIAQQPVNTVIQEMGTSVKITFMFKIEGRTERIVTIISTESENAIPTIIEDIQLEGEIKPITFINSTSASGVSIMITNDVTTAIKKDPKVEIVIEEIRVKYPEIRVENIQTIQSSDFSATVQYNFVAETTTGSVEQVQIILVKETNEVRITDSQVMDINMEDPVLVQPVELPVVQILPEEFETPEYLNVVNYVRNTETYTKESKVVSIFRSENTINVNFQIELKDKLGEIVRVDVNQDKETALPEITNVGIVNQTFVASAPVMIKEVCDPVTAVKTTVYSTASTFKRDSYFNIITSHVQTSLPILNNYEVKSAVKEVFGDNNEYHILFKQEGQSPEQVTIVVNTITNQVSIIEEKKLTDPEVEIDPLAPVVPEPETITLSNLEKENIKILSQIGNIPEVAGYTEITDLSSLEKDQVFLGAASKVKAQYALLLKDAIVVKVMEKHSLNKEAMKLFYKVNDQIYEADVEISGVNNEVRITDFSKVGSDEQSSTININVDLAYGYEVIQDFNAEKNIEFLISYIREKYSSLLEGSVIKSAEKLVLANGRVNYKIYFKSDLQSIKFIVYYEPVFKRVLEVRSYNFETGKSFTQISLDRLVNDPYFKKVDTAVKGKHKSEVSNCEVLKVENKDVGSKIIFRTVYACG